MTVKSALQKYPKESFVLKKKIPEIIGNNKPYLTLEQKFDKWWMLKAIKWIKWDIYRVLSITTLNINCLINLVKDTPHHQREATLGQGWKNSLKANGTTKKTDIIVIILEKIDFKSKLLRKDKGYIILIKRTIIQDGFIILTHTHRNLVQPIS